MSGEPRGVNRQLWAEALELAGGEAARIEIRSATSLVVHNSDDWKPQPEPAAKPAAKAVVKPATRTGARPAVKPSNGKPAPDSGRRAKSRPQPELTGPLPLPEWRSATPVRNLQPTPVQPKSDVPAFLAPAQRASSG